MRYWDALYFIIAGTIWYTLRISLKQKESVKQKSFDDEITFEEITPFEFEKETEILNRTFLQINYLIHYTKSSKSHIEYVRSLKHLKSLVMSEGGNKKLPKINFPIESTNHLHSTEFCNEKNLFGKDIADEYQYPLWFQPPLDPLCQAQPMSSLVTVLFNFVNEIAIQKAETLLEDVAACSERELSYVVFLPRDSSYDRLTKIVTSKIPNMRIVESEQDSTQTSHAKILNEAMSKITTKYTIITRNTERFDNFSSIIRLVRDISIGNAVIVGGSQRNISGHWKAGCYQMKIDGDQVHIEEGYDVSENMCMYCDYLSTPFGVKTNLLRKYLKGVDTTLTGDFFYMEFQMKIRFLLKQEVYSCIDAMFHTQTSGVQTNKKEEWKPFLSKYGYSKATVVFADQTHVIQFPCQAVGIDCTPNPTKGTKDCCFLEAEHILREITEALAKKQILHNFLLPTGSEFWTKISEGLQQQDKQVISLQTQVEPSALKGFIKLDGFQWNGREFSSNSWRIIFLKFETSKVTNVNIVYGNLSLPADCYPGDGLVSNIYDNCFVCFDLLHYYRNLRSTKIWV